MSHHTSSRRYQPAFGVHGVGERAAPRPAAGECAGSDPVERSLEATNAVVQQLFHVGLGLAAAIQLTEGPARERLARAAEDLDDAIKALRAVAAEISVAGGAAGTGSSPGPPGSCHLDPLIRRIGADLRTVVGLVAHSLPPGPQAIHLEDAAHSLSRAAAALGFAAETARPQGVTVEGPG